jgi:VIT1/CCC1 family predicted Fe2+/Mn2+ transporter
MLHERDVMIEHESIPDLLKDLRDEVMVMIRQQIELARTETSEKVSVLGKNAMYLAAGGLVLFAGFLFLLGSLTLLVYVGLLIAGMSPVVAVWLVPLFTAIVVGIVGGVLIKKSLRTFRNTSFVPEKMVHTFKEDQQWINQKVR